jgi:hypothetical protein
MGCGWDWITIDLEVDADTAAESEAAFGASILVASDVEEGGGDL